MWIPLRGRYAGVYDHTWYEKFLREISKQPLNSTLPKEMSESSVGLAELIVPKLCDGNCAVYVHVLALCYGCNLL